MISVILLVCFIHNKDLKYKEMTYKMVDILLRNKSKRLKPGLCHLEVNKFCF